MQLPDAADDIAVRIFVEFKRQESAVKGMSLSLQIENSNYKWI